MNNALKIFEGLAFFVFFMIAIIWIYTRKVKRDVCCPYCGFTYALESQLKKEMSGQKLNGKIVVCGSCNKRFKIVELRSLAIGVDSNFSAKKLE